MLGIVGFVMLAFGVAFRVGARDSARGYLVTMVCLLLAASVWVVSSAGLLRDNEAMMVGLMAIGLSCIAVGAAAGEAYLFYAKRS